MEYDHTTYLRRISLWGKMVGSMTLIYGIVAIIVGMLTYYVHIIPGLVSIFLGKLLFDMGREAKKALQSTEEGENAVGKVIRSYSVFIACLGILILITIVCYIAFIYLGLF